MLICAPYLLREDINADKTRKVFVLPNKSMLILGMIAFCSMMCQGALFDWTGVYFKKVMTVDKEWIGAGYTAFTVSMALVRFVTDRITAYTGLKRVLFYSGIATALGLLLIVFFPYLVPAIIGCMLGGIGVSPSVPLVFSAAGKTKGMSPGVAIAAVSTLGFIGLLIGPVLIGFIAGATSLKVSFVIIALIGLIFSALSLKVKEE
jgi:MFS family permease